MVSSILLLFCLPSLAYSLICHRCFGNGFCHDPEHSEFPAGIRNATCSSASYWSHTGEEDSYMLEVERVLNENFQKHFRNASTQNTTLEQQCITATVHEPQDSFTLRTCVTRSIPTEGTFPNLCDFIEEYIAHQNFYNGSYICRQCNDGDFCNSHVLEAGDSQISPTSGAIRIGSVSVLYLMIGVFLKL